jgi:hypothetical protein
MIKNILKYLWAERSVPWRQPLAAVLIMVLVVAGNPTLLSGAALQEYQVKAAFINNIARFVQWPTGTLADPEEPFGLYILGEDRFGSAFDSFEGKIIHNSSLVVRRIEAWEDIPADCRMLYVGVSEKKEIRRLLERISDRAILTISDEPMFIESGGIIGLVTVNDRVRFTVNLSPALEAGLVISSNLIKLAISIHGEAR